MTEQLWTEKYRPKTLKSYIGNEKIINQVQTWIKSQNNYEFDKPKILVLSGKPGVGKTTLAHIIYNLYDYDIIELNASIARTKKFLIDQITSINTKSITSFLTGDEDKRIGLIMDEIDGIDTTDTINSFVKLIKQPPKTPKTSNEYSLKQRKKIYTKFPVICTCNNSKDKKLTTLFKNSLHIILSFPNEKDLLKLGKKIIKKENINLSIQKLKTIIKNNVKDYRDLINILYLYKTNINGDIKRNDVEMNNREHNDDSISLKTEYMMNSIVKIFIDDKKLNKSTDTNNKIDSINNIIYFGAGIEEMISHTFYNNLTKIFNKLNINNKKLTQTQFNDIINTIYNNSICSNNIREYMRRTQSWSLYTYPIFIGFIGIILKITEFLDNEKKLKITGNDNYYLEYYTDIHRIIHNLAENKKKLSLLEFRIPNNSIDISNIKGKYKTKVKKLINDNNINININKYNGNSGIGNISEIYYMNDDDILKYVSSENIAFVSKIKKNINNILKL